VRRQRPTYKQVSQVSGSRVIVLPCGGRHGWPSG